MREKTKNIWLCCTITALSHLAMPVSINKTYLLGAWFIAHVIYKALGYRPSTKGVNGRIDPDRRQFLKWIGTGLVGTVVIGALDPLTIIRQVLSAGLGRRGHVGTGGRFVEFYTITNGYPDATLSGYRLQVAGLVEQPVTLNCSQLTALAPAQQKEDFHCVTGWSVAGVQWKGVRLSSIMTQVKPLAEARYVHFYSFDGVYTESLSIQEALDPSVMLAYQLNGLPLSIQQGFPVRLVVPKMYGYKSIKWVNRLEFGNQPLTGYWEARGYPNEAFIGRSI